MESNFYPGRRLSYEGHLCTVRYLGLLAGTTGQWLGVEWDNPSRGKHSGQHNGQQIFACRSISPTAASFVRPTRKHDEERTVLEAIKFKYGSAATDGAFDADIVIISGKVAEEVGFAKIAKEQAQLAALRIVLIDQLVVNGLVHRTADPEHVIDAQKELSATCPNITELDLGWNTIENWSQVAGICAALQNLKTLRLGYAIGPRCPFSYAHLLFRGLRFDASRIPVYHNALSRVRELHLEECLLTPDDICDLLSVSSNFSGLQELHLSGNDLNSLEPTGGASLPYVPTVKTLVIENNLFTNLSCLKDITIFFPAVQSVSLQANQISAIGNSLETSSQTFPQIETFNVSYNTISSYAFVNSLPQILPSLSSLRISNNPLYQQKASTEANDARASDKSYYLTLARIPTLNTLNYAKISARDREEGEMYYLSLAEKELRALFSKDKDKSELVREAERLHPRYHLLTLKYHRDSVIDQLLSATDAAGNQISTMLKVPNRSIHLDQSRPVSSGQHSTLLDMMLKPPCNCHHLYLRHS